MTKCSTPRPAIQPTADRGNCGSLAISPIARASGRKQTTPSGTLIDIACSGVPLTTPRRTEALFNANDAAERTANKAPSTNGPGGLSCGASMALGAAAAGENCVERCAAAKTSDSLRGRRPGYRAQ